MVPAMDISNILIWNVRGLNRKSRRDSVRALIAAANPQLVCLQETKVQSMSQRILLSTLGADLDHHVELPAQGTRVVSSLRGMVRFAQPS